MSYDDVSGLVESGHLDPLAALHSGGVGANAGARPVGGGRRIGEGLPVLNDAHQELVGQVGMRPAVASALDEGHNIELKLSKPLPVYSDGNRESVLSPMISRLPSCSLW